MLTLPTQQPTQQELAALKAAADRLDNIEWLPPTEVYDDHGCRGREILSVENDTVIGEAIGPNDAEACFMALANPKAVAALLALIDAQQKKIDSLEAKAAEIGMADGWVAL